MNNEVASVLRHVLDHEVPLALLFTFSFGASAGA